MKLLRTNDKKLLNQQKINASQKMMNQQGAALIIFILVLILSAATYFVGGLSSNTVALDREKQTQAALAEAKAALIGDAVQSQSLVLFGANTQPVTLSNPDEGSSSAINEGSETGTYGTTDSTLIGKLPWQSLNIAPLRDGWGECLWYVVSGRFKHSPSTQSALNWDTQGQIDVIDEKGNQLASNLAALIIAPGPVLSGQDRSSGQTVYPQCGGNYDVKNYLDTPNGSNAISGALNYYLGSQNNGVAPDSSNKTFVLANTANYNDRFEFITVDDIFNRVMQRSDFSGGITTLLKSLQSTPVLSNNNGTDSSQCASNDFFCENWIGMVFVKDYSLMTVTVTVTWIDPTNPKNTSSKSCNRVIIFGGKKDAASQYLDPQNLQSFNSTATSSLSYQGTLKFNAKFPTLDVIECV